METSPSTLEKLLSRLKEAGIDITPEVLEELIGFAEKYVKNPIIGSALTEFQKSFDELETASKKVESDKKTATTDKSSTVIVSATAVVPQVDESNLTIAKEAFGQKYGELVIATNTLRELIAEAEANVEDKRKQLGELEKNLTDNRGLLDTERATLEGYRSQYEEAQLKLDALTAEHGAVKAKLDQQEGFNQTLQETVGKLEGIIKGKEGEIETLKDDNAEKDKALKALPANTDVEVLVVDGGRVNADGVRTLRDERDEAHKKVQGMVPQWQLQFAAAVAILALLIGAVYMFKFYTFDAGKEMKALQTKYDRLSDGYKAEVTIKEQLQAAIASIGSNVGVNANGSELEKSGGIDRKRSEIGTKIKELQGLVGKSDDDRVAQLEGNLKQRDEEIASLKQKVDANNGAALPAPPFLVEEAKCPPIVVTGDSNPFSLVKIPAKGTKDRFLFARVLSMEGEEPLFTVCRDPENMVQVHESVDGYPLGQNVCRWKTEKHAGNDRQEE